MELFIITEKLQGRTFITVSDILAMHGKDFTALLKTIFILIFILYDISTTSNLPNESMAECPNFNLVYCLLEA